MANYLLSICFGTKALYDDVIVLESNLGKGGFFVLHPAFEGEAMDAISQGIVAVVIMSIGGL